VVFAASGTEANEQAIKIARVHTGRRGIVVVAGAFHGTSLGTLPAIGQMADMMGFGSPDVTVVAWNDLGAMDAALNERVGLVLLESIPATSGFPLPAPGYLSGVKSLCEQHGALLCLDEVQTGLGRTGRMWSFQHDGVMPDVVVVGKGLSGGVYPVAATMLSAQLFATYSKLPRFHISTFGGAELGCVAAITVLDLIDDDLLARVNALAAQFAAGLSGQRFGFHGRGLTMALTVGDGLDNWAAWDRIRAEGVFPYPATFTTDVLQLQPALILQPGEAEEIIAGIIRAIG
jgi:acetylornithine/succinyldiaminopimelate/putrescine aminotransferase